MKNENAPYLIVGLGNPGQQYRMNRHNAGFLVADTLAEMASIPLTRVKFRALMGKGTFAGAPVVIAKPQTYMNDSGQAVGSLMRFFKVPNDHLLVVHDDLDLPFGTLRLRPSGGTGGQRGMESIVKRIGTRDFARLRVGIGRPPGRMDPKDYVLHDFEADQIEWLPGLRETAVEAIRSFIVEGIDKAMTTFNGKVFDED